MKVLIVGSGGREHCLAWKISQSDLVDKIYCAPGNGGTSLIAENINITAVDIDSLLKFAIDKKVDLTIVGPEAPLVEGIVDKFEEKQLKIFGPQKSLALLEGSKIFAKELMKKYNVPTADFRAFDDPDEAKKYIDGKTMPLVVKADGLAAGKGVMICESIKEAKQAIDEIMVERRFGSSGQKLIIEDFIQGEEVSVLIFTDGKTIIPLASSQDHKRAFDQDKGPNTGGMGAYSPAPFISKDMFEVIISKVFMPLIKGLAADGSIYKGVLYGGLMIKDNDPYVLEFNVRFGDPETQAILPKLRSDLADLMLKTVEGRLEGVELEWDERFCLCVVLASGGYPGSYQKNKIITGLEELKNNNDIFIFHAGTRFEKDSFLTNGGRVLNVVGLDNKISGAQDKVYAAIGDIEFEGMFFRRDIGSKMLGGCRK